MWHGTDVSVETTVLAHPDFREAGAVASMDGCTWTTVELAVARGFTKLAVVTVALKRCSERFVFMWFGMVQHRCMMHLRSEDPLGPWVQLPCCR